MVEDFIIFTESIFGKIDNITSEKISILDRSRITPQYDKNNNYELLELYGDKVLQEQFCLYLMDKVGNHENAVNIITRLIIKFLSGEYLTNLCKHIGLSAFIKDGGNLNAYEDVFEAWIGACRLIYITSHFSNGVFKLFDMFPISFGFQDLYDPRSILNDFSSAIQTKMVNKGTRKISANEFENKTTIGGDVMPVMIGVGYAKTKKQAEQESARKILDNYISVFGVINFFDQLKKTKTYLKWRDFFLSYNNC